jgi:hypothetical protein
MGESSGGGYMTYLSRLRLGGDVQTMYGGPPAGKSLETWFKRAPTFNLDRVDTPLRIVVASPYYLLYDWEMFEGLNINEKPVDMVMLESGDHVLKRPMERMVASGGNVDWFSFWLLGQEDGADGKVSQYTRWRQMRDVIEATNRSKPQHSTAGTTER